MAVNVKTVVYWYMMSSGLKDRYHCLQSICCLQLLQPWRRK